MSGDDFQNFLPQFGAVAGEEVGEDFRAMVKSELAKWSEVAEQANLKR